MDSFLRPMTDYSARVWGQFSIMNAGWFQKTVVVRNAHDSATSPTRSYSTRPHPHAGAR